MLELVAFCRGENSLKVFMPRPWWNSIGVQVRSHEGGNYRQGTSNPEASSIYKHGRFPGSRKYLEYAPGYFAFATLASCQR